MQKKKIACRGQKYFIVCFFFSFVIGAPFIKRGYCFSGCMAFKHLPKVCNRTVILKKNKKKLKKSKPSNITQQHGFAQEFYGTLWHTMGRLHQCHYSKRSPVCKPNRICSSFCRAPLLINDLHWLRDMSGAKTTEERGI